MSSRPNILLICADQLRADALGCYGNPVCRTPNLDALAASGVRLANCYSPNPICVPARASVTTGNYSHRATGCKDNGGLIHGDGQVKLAEHFAAAGYETYSCGKLHYVPYAAPGEPRLLHGFQHCDLHESGRVLAEFDPKNERRGVEDYMDYLADVGWKGYSRAHGIGNNDVRPCTSPLPPEHCPDHWVADRTIERITAHVRDKGDKPFLMWCSFPKPHSPYDPPRGYADLYDPREVPPPFGDESLLADRDPELTRERFVRAQSTLSPEARRVIKAYYYGLITFQDEQVGRVLAALERAGVADNTIVIYLADHGDLMGDFGVYFKCSWLEGSSHVPMIVRVPGGPSGAVRNQLVGLQDILPTLATLAGCPLPYDVDGEDLTAIINDDAAGRELFYGQCCESPSQSAMIFDGRMKYSYCERGATEELYDLAEDPQELVNLAAGPDGAERAAPWRTRLIAEIKRWGDAGMLNGDALVQSPADRAAMANLPINGMGWRWY